MPLQPSQPRAERQTKAWFFSRITWSRLAQRGRLFRHWNRFASTATGEDMTIAAYPGLTFTLARKELVLRFATMRLICHVALSFGVIGAAVAQRVSAAAVGAATVSQQCERLYAKGWRPLPGRHEASVPAMPRPAKGVALADPVYGSCVIRATDHKAETGEGFLRNDYSRREAFNADSSRFIVNSEDGSWHLYDAERLTYLKRLSDLSGDAEPQWHPTNPRLLRFFPRDGVGMKLYELNVERGSSRVIADFGRRVRNIWPTAQSVWTRSEGSPSSDQRYWALQADSGTWQGLGLITYDLQEDKILATYDFGAHRKDRPDHVSMSPSGAYVVVSWNDGVVAFNRDLTQPRLLQKKGEHSDIAVGAQGDDTYVAVDYESNGGQVFMVNLRTGERTDLFPSYVRGTATAMHFSGKAFKFPGWVLVSTYADYGRGGQQWLHRKLFAVELKANPSIMNIAYHHSTPAKYWTEPQASVNRDFTRILFNSNWGTASETDVDAYMVALPFQSLVTRP